ncbi:hypothetical protein [Methylobacterium aerolatum]|uniref:Uncharacterized protein n=1 Tax=Methylobacterium aerolatum TaxID=418708 RepID=A0ABU0HXH5_9HYPH|nr:hypothetical protein [Methylobacterium aerolatum]MDQ0447053.1 hypothetical protein [Methylobacterium aerolatum]
MRLDLPDMLLVAGKLSERLAQDIDLCHPFDQDDEGGTVVTGRVPDLVREHSPNPPGSCSGR